MQHMITNAVARYPRIDKPYKFDPNEGDFGKTVPCSKDDQGAQYEMSFVLDKAGASDLKRVCLDAYANAAKMAKRPWPEQPKRLPIKAQPIKDMNGNETGEMEFVGKTNIKAKYPSGYVDTPPQYDAQRNKLPADFQLTTGSKVNVAVVVVPYYQSPENYGVTLRLRAVQVLEYKEPEAANPFDAIDGGFVSGGVADDPFGLPPVKSAPAPQPSNTALDDLNDEIPF
jgi:hypothetical protein